MWNEHDAAVPGTVVLTADVFWGKPPWHDRVRLRPAGDPIQPSDAFSLTASISAKR